MRDNKKSALIKEKLEIGTIYQKAEGGNFSFRYQLDNNRKEINLKTNNLEEACRLAHNLLPTLKSSTIETVEAHVKEAKGLLGIRQSISLSDAWKIYSQHPERAMPATVSEQQGYESTWNEFVAYVGKPGMSLREVDYKIANGYAGYLKTKSHAVDTHNRKIKRIRKVFNTLTEYWDGVNPFQSRSLLRKAREEQGMGVRRLGFTREHVQKLLAVLDDPAKKVKNKTEIRVIFHLGIYTGQRLKDCVLLRWNKVDMARKMIWVQQFKTGKEVTIPVAPQLMKVLMEARQWKTSDSDYICPNVAKRYNYTNSQGKNTGSDLVNNDVLRVITWIGVETSTKVPERHKSVTVYGFHSLRHSFASHCAEIGVPKAVVQSILGAETDIIDKYYTHVGDDAQIKAIEAIAGTVSVLSAQDKIDKVLQLIDEQKEVTPEIQAIKDILRE